MKLPSINHHGFAILSALEQGPLTTPLLTGRLARIDGFIHGQTFYQIVYRLAGQRMLKVGKARTVGNRPQNSYAITATGRAACELVREFYRSALWHELKADDTTLEQWP